MLHLLFVKQLLMMIAPLTSIKPPSIGMIFVLILMGEMRQRCYSSEKCLMFRNYQLSVAKWKLPLPESANKSKT